MRLSSGIHKSEAPTILLLSNRFIVYFKKITVLIAVLLISYLTAELFWRLYEWAFSIKGGSIFIGYDLVAKYIFGAVAAYFFFLSCLFTIFGNKNKYLWIGILLIPAVLFEVYFDLAHIYFPIIIGLIGWLIGLMASKMFLNTNKTQK